LASIQVFPSRAEKKSDLSVDGRRKFFYTYNKRFLARQGFLTSSADSAEETFPS
jgi:hypothetical protein